MTIFWFRRDLRLEDNTALFHALNENEEVLPIFIFDTTILKHLDKQDARVSFIHQELNKINLKLKSIGKSLALFYGTPEEIFNQLIAENSIEAVYANHDYEPAARKRDKSVNELLKSNGISFKTCKDQVIFEKSEVVKEDGSPYVVYTPYSKKWLEKFKSIQLNNYPSETLTHKFTNHNYPFLTLENIGFVPTSIRLPHFTIDEKRISNYEGTRNFPAIEGTSLIGIHLRFGTISIRKLVNYVQNFSNVTYLKELIWREFFMQILWHFPHTTAKSFKEKYDAIEWLNNELDFNKWCEGKTGYPFVDAGMRELNATGHMHNRVRMIVASFLCKHLLIDWRWGEAYFATKLLDYEQASNVGNWQWAAGSGVDAAPYFRIFNPTEQIKKFDSELKYIKKWIPELNTSNYPEPIIEHKLARERCLTTYKKAVG
ncbi:Deoxyribodipyrimidine photolyase PhrB1 [Flavobacterium indicum GPTSA100-9 = DSM 17447]|uniref:Deoxyribodipyrimidine photolyase PhrB1 n=1 Tax=Flavobacterium indicum (strain DSM 17447 / CIP 109464 / GPTSA100-9) TaxID=1094466 RepID=H8XQX2_FLAIG|nr:deoxyribodipyrimidine photo-lyase [Flavobacterium indicum]CCG53420.1 Deoxyribodipyrimidine photolyase PhrB1 [Flavobacterium indicum GPTSA100-9 = DSM 17447]